MFILEIVESTEWEGPRLHTTEVFVQNNTMISNALAAAHTT